MLEGVHVERSRLEQDPRVFFDFFRAFSSAPMPLQFLEEHAIAEEALFQLLGGWQRRLAEDPVLRAEVMQLLRELPRPIANVGPSKPEPSQEPAHESPAPVHAQISPPPKVALPVAAPLAMTSLGFVVDRPALPFVKASSERPTPLMEPSPVRAAPRGLGETRPVFQVDRALFPFAARKEMPKHEGPRMPEPAPSRSLAETAPSFFNAKAALPFQRSETPVMAPREEPKIAPPPRALGDTRPVFHTYKAVALPFQKSLGQTAPSFQIDKQALPFVKGEAALPPKEPPKPASLLGETSLLLGVNLSSILPFAKPAAPAPRLSIEVYATLCAEIWLAPADALSIVARYGLNPDLKRAEDAAWQARFSASPNERKEWERLAIEAGARIRRR